MICTQNTDSDNTDILEIDYYSPVAIKRGEDKMREDYRKEKEIEAK